MASPLLTRSRRDERGAASAELAGAIVVAVILILALVGSSPAWGQRIGDGIRDAICSIFGQGCEAAGEDPRKPDYACVKNESSRTKTVRQTVVIDVETGGRIQVQEMSDGTYQVSATGIAGIGISAGDALGGRATVDGQDYGAYGSYSAGVEGKGESTVTYTVSSAEEKDKLVNYLQTQTDTGVLTSASPIIGIGKLALDWLTDHNGTRSYTPPKPTSVTVQAGRGAEAQASGALLDKAASVSAGTSQAVGMTRNADGTQVVYYQTTIGLDAEGNVALTGTDASASGQHQALIAVTVDQNGKPSQVSLAAELSGDASAEMVSAFTGDKMEASAAGGKVYEFTVDMTDPRSAQAGANLLMAAGIETLLPSGAVPSKVLPAVPGFIDAAMDNDTSTVTRRDVTRDGQTDFGFDIDGKFRGIGIGIGYSDESANAQYGNGEYWDGSAWQTWDGC